jgi:cytochrome c peroxidase
VEALGRWIVTREPKDIGAFKTPGLRNVALTAPYMHDGSLKTLEEVMEFYNKGGEPNPNLDGGMRPLGLTPEEIADLVEFMKSLTDENGGKNFNWEELKQLAQKTRAGELVPAPAP